MAKFKDKERILKAAKEKELVTYKRVPIRNSSDFSTERPMARRYWHNVFKVMKNKGIQPKLLYPARLELGSI